MYKKAVTFSYDDGIEQDRRLVDIFNSYGMKCTFNLNTGIQSEESHFEIDGVKIHRMNQEDIGDLYKGHEIAVHGLTHTGPTGLLLEELEQEFYQDAKNIERIYGKYPVGMAYAYGDCDERVAKYLQSIGIRYGRTVGSTHGFDLPKEPMLLEATCHHNDEQLFALAKQFLEAEPDDGKPMLFYIWGHSYEFDVNRNWDRIERLCEMLAGHEDIFCGTNAECLLDNPFA
ncbi:MAG: polysaccharide deacetylase family protein [Lachnospiraceae bacterium]|nr:polysaccharide deacetylase family protein [Lachnospiraceae bacterium]